MALAMQLPALRFRNPYGVLHLKTLISRRSLLIFRNQHPVMPFPARDRFKVFDAHAAEWMTIQEGVCV
jgi:hypothetical protein